MIQSRMAGGKLSRPRRMTGSRRDGEKHAGSDRRSVWSGVVAPRNTPAEIIDKLNVAINTGLADPKIKTRLSDLGNTVLAGTPADFAKLIADETEKWAKVIKSRASRRTDPGSMGKLASPSDELL